jgi:hypothetical protein
MVKLILDYIYIKSSVWYRNRLEYSKREEIPEVLDVFWVSLYLIYIDKKLQIRLELIDKEDWV